MSYLKQKLKASITLLQDNACPHAANQAQELMDKQIYHPPYSSELVPSVFHLFLNFKKHLRSQCHYDGDVNHPTVVVQSGGRFH